MSTTVISSENETAGPWWPALSRLARHAILARLRRIQWGSLTIVEESCTSEMGGNDGPSVTIFVRDPRAFWMSLLGGSSGSGEAYARGYWSCDRLTDLVRIFLRNESALRGLDGGWALLQWPARWLAHCWRANTRGGSQRNIAAHYDLGNDFFQLFLDETLMYSCAIFDDPRDSLFKASVNKLDRVCQKLELQPDDHLLEIGTGWGGFALHAALQYGCRVTTTTISRKQYDLATQRVRDAGLQERVTVLPCDYRDLTGQFDKLVSIEMIEAVGHAYHDVFLRQCSQLLRPDGMMLLQMITVEDRFYDSARNSADFIQSHIFPGSCLPSIAKITASLARATDFRVYHLEDITPHYATTLRLWCERLHAQRDALLQRGYTDTLLRLWDYYFCYCEGGFLERTIGDVQLLLTKPRCQRAAITPPLLETAARS